MLNKFYNKINVRVLITMLILFLASGIAVGMMNQYMLHSIYEKSFMERALLSNNIMASFIDYKEIEYYADLMRSKDDDFKKRQLQFYYDREELFRLLEEGAPTDEQTVIISRIEAFYNELNELKSESYWHSLENFRKLKNTSLSKYVYVFADTGLTADDGTKLYTFIFDAEDNAVNINPDTDGLGTVYSVENFLLNEMYETKKPLDSVIHYSGEPYGECYFAYAPILDDSNNVIAFLGTDIDLENMKQEINNSMLMFNIGFFLFAVLIMLVLYIFLRRFITKPLAEITNTAQRIADGDIYTQMPAGALKQKSELGTLSNVVKNMIGVYQNMIGNRVILDTNPFTCVIFDEKMNIVDCNPMALKFYNFSSKEEMASGYLKLLTSAIPPCQPDGSKSKTLNDRVQTLHENGYCEFETAMIFYGKQYVLKTIMKLANYNNKPAIVVYQFDLTKQKEIQNKLEYHNSLLKAISDVANLFLSVQPENFETTLHNAFGIIGRAASADRVYIWKNQEDTNGKLYMTQLYEWSPDAEPQQGNELTVNISYDEAFSSWKETLFKGQSLNSLVKDMRSEEQEHLLPQGIVSILIVPIYIQGKFWGFIGFDDCCKERVFTTVEENILRICGYMIMAVDDIIKNEIAMSLIAAKNEALSTARTKSNFLANMSHEIRTPMNAILGMTELILHEDTTDTILNYADDIKNACKGLLALINDILDISKIESGKLEIMPAGYQLSSLLMDVISIIKMRADKKNLPFVVNLDSRLPCKLIGDELRVKQILINLLNNAVKFTNDGQITLTVTSERIDGRIRMKCEVSDTGTGIKQEDMEKLFESFQQIDTRKNREIEGSGLGLSISKQLVEMMDGSVSVESEYDKGSTFTVVIWQDIENDQPMTSLKKDNNNLVLVYENRKAYLDSITYSLESLDCRYMICHNQSELNEMLNENKYSYIFTSALHANKTQALKEKMHQNSIIVALNGDGSSQLESGIISISMPIHCLQIANIINGDYSGLRDKSNSGNNTISISAPDAKILVVDDNLVNLKVAAGLLKTYDIQAHTASSGKRAIEMVQETKYDLVFMDHMMPEMDGIDTSIAIRKLDGVYFKKLPLIALTANAIRGAREMFKAEGLDDYLAKPIEMSKLNNILEKWIPKEKQLLKTQTTKQDHTDLEISGVNVQSGLERSGGSLENYIEILSVYFADGKRMIDEIENSRQKGDYKLLTTYSHALKSASANIGAEELSSFAEELEFSGKNGNIAYVEDNIKPFTGQLSILLTNIKCYLDTLKKKTTERDKTANWDFLKESIIKINESLGNADIEAVEKFLDELGTYKWEENISGLIDKMKEYAGFFDYDGMESTFAEIKTAADCND